jgi:hypothetical protein
MFELWGKEYWGEDSRAVTFQAIADQRPLTVDADAVSDRDDSWKRAIDDDGSYPKSLAYREKGKDLEETTAYGWIWVCHDRSFYEVAEDLELHANEGDDINMWLAVVENHYLLE